MDAVSRPEPSTTDDSALRCAQSLLWLAPQLARQANRSTGAGLQAQWQRLAATLHADPSPAGMAVAVRALLQLLRFEESGWQSRPHPHELPMIALLPGVGLRLVHGREPDGRWRLEGPQGREGCADWPPGAVFTAARPHADLPPHASARALFRQLAGAQRGWVGLAVLASAVGSVLALGISFYSMQVYDRVIGARSLSTLVVLTVGVGLAILLELLVKCARSAIVDAAAADTDHRCGHAIFERLLGVRLDQPAGGVGHLASQVRGYETVRAYALARSLFLAADAPFAALFLATIVLIGGPLVASVPVVFLLAALAIGLGFNHGIERAARAQQGASNRRHGLLVEAIDGAETLKSAGAGWQLLNRWSELSRKVVQESMAIKHLSDLSGYVTGAMQQVAYVCLVAVGAWLAITSPDITSGAIIACSILSGRVLAPVGMLPGLLVQRAHARAALDGLDRLFALESENQGVPSPLRPQAVTGDYQLRDLRFVYPGQVTAVAIEALTIGAGERVAIIGPAGAGKSTLLRLLAGLLRPQRGNVLLDGLDLQQVATDSRAEMVGYLAQRPVLFAGTLRDNLVLGLPPVGDASVLAACRSSGLESLVVARTEGLSMPIGEGGGGLSGGQAQLTALTRMLLARPQVWLLDEPTASMDDVAEARCIAALHEAVQPGQTLVLATHKASLLQLVDRVIVLTPAGIALDGPRAQVLARLRAGAATPHGPKAIGGTP